MGTVKMKNKKIYSILAIILLLTLTITTIPTMAGEYNSVYGYLYINNAIAPSGMEVKLSFDGDPLTDETDSNGYYQIDFSGHNWDEGYFSVYYNGDWRDPLDNQSVEIIPSEIGYEIDLHIEISNNPPNTPSNPSPGNGATGIEINDDLSWTGGDPDIGDTVTYDVYFGTVNPPTTMVSSAQSGTSYNPGAMGYSTTYYWKIVALDNHGASTYGPVWSFATKQQTTGGDTDGNTGGGNNPPTADAGGPYFGTPNSEIEFDGAASSDTDGTIVQYDWKFFNTDTWHNNLGVTPTHTYTEPGTYQVTLRVTDDDGSKDEDATTAIISQPNNPPTTPIITGPTDGDHNISYEFTFISTDADNDTLQYMIDWDDETTTTTEFTTSGIVVTQTHSWMPGRYTLTAKASDNQTESTTADHTIYIDAEQVGDIGYLTDTNGDGIYDLFSSDTTGKTSAPEHQTDGTYFIDNDADGDWDYIYDPQTKRLTTYPTKEEGAPQSDMTLMVLGGILGIIAVLFIIFLLLTRKKKTEPVPPTAEQTVAEVPLTKTTGKNQTTKRAKKK
jgi:PKD repeat protein